MCEMLKQIATQSGLVATVVGTIMSAVLELWPSWAGWKHKRRFVFVLCLSIPVGGLVVGTYFMACGLELTLATFAVALYAGIEAFIAATAAFKLYVSKHIAMRE